jgi:hypothetical protein
VLALVILQGGGQHDGAWEDAELACDHIPVNQKLERLGSLISNELDRVPLERALVTVSGEPHDLPPVP